MTALEEAVVFLLESHESGNWDPKAASILAAVIRNPYLKEPSAKPELPRGADGYGSTGR